MMDGAGGVASDRVTNGHNSASRKTSIVIVGAGIIGASTAYYLTRNRSYNPETTEITIIEATVPAAGASGKAGGLLALDWHGLPTADLARLSFGLHEQLAKEHGGEQRWDYRKLHTLQVFASEKVTSKKGGSNLPAECNWLNADLIHDVAMLGTPDTTAQCHPYKLTTSLLQLAQDSGVRYIHGRVCAIEDGQVTFVDQSGAHGDPFTQHKIQSSKTVVTAGPWTSSLLPGAPVTATRAHSITISTPNPVSAHAVFSEIRVEAEPKGGKRRTSIVTPEMYPRRDEVYACGEGDEADPLPDAADKVICVTSRCDDIKRQIDILSPYLKDCKIAVRQACYLPVVEKGNGGPLVGEVKGGLYVAAGHSVWGICLGPGTGKVMSEIIYDGVATSADVKLLDPTRLMRKKN